MHEELEMRTHADAFPAFDCCCSVNLLMGGLAALVWGPASNR
jgi:hypothetical protein